MKVFEVQLPKGELYTTSPEKMFFDSLVLSGDLVIPAKILLSYSSETNVITVVCDDSFDIVDLRNKALAFISDTSKFV